MNQTSKSMEKKIRSVKTWLDRAEQAYADDSTAKGQLQLMLAKAEMKHLDEQQDKRKSYLRYAMYVLTLSLTLLALFFAFKSPSTVTKPVNDGTPAVTNSVNSTTNSSAPGNGTGQNGIIQNGSGQSATGNSVAPTGTGTNSSVPVGTATNDGAITETDSTAITNSGTSTSGDSGAASSTSSEAGNESTADTSYTSGQTATEAASGNNESSTAEPVISNTQIQEAVREGGRSLRGQ